MTSVPRAAAALLFLALLPAAEARAQDPDSARTQAARLTAEEIDTLVAPIALYPDPLLAQVLVAATFADQIEEAAAFVRANGTDSVDAQGWDVSVRAVAHYPPILNRMAEQPDWTTALGRAYALQSGDVMDAVQRLRALASAHGNLRTTPEQEVVIRGKNVIIAPAQPTVVYVPAYDPWMVYYEPIFLGRYRARFWSFGIGFRIGPWLGYDCDWIGRRIFHHGWAGGWRGRSRPWIHMDRRYAGSGPVGVNRAILDRTDIARYPVQSRTLNRTVFWDQMNNAPLVHRSGTATGGGTAGGGGQTVFPRDLRRGTQGSIGGDYRGVVRPGARGTAPVIRGPASGGGTASQGTTYRLAPVNKRPAAGKSAGTYVAPTHPRGGTTTSRPAAGPSTTRPPSRGFGTVTPSRPPSGRKP